MHGLDCTLGTYGQKVSPDWFINARVMMQAPQRCHWPSSSLNKSATAPDFTTEGLRLTYLAALQLGQRLGMLDNAGIIIDDIIVKCIRAIGCVRQQVMSGPPWGTQPHSRIIAHRPQAPHTCAQKL